MQHETNLRHCQRSSWQDGVVSTAGKIGGGICFTTHYLSKIQTFRVNHCIFSLPLSFVRKNYCTLAADNLAWCIYTLHANASMPQHTPSLLVGFTPIVRRLGGLKRHDIIKAFT